MSMSMVVGAEIMLLTLRLFAEDPVDFRIEAL